MHFSDKHFAEVDTK